MTAPVQDGPGARSPARTRRIIGSDRPFDEAAARASAERNADGGVQDQRAQGRQIGAQWHGGRIEAITRPTLVLHGEDDALIKPRAGRVIASRIPGSRLVPLPGVGHELPEPAWERVAAEMRGLADTAGPPPPGSGTVTPDP
ncbi:alpha/beta hydrolase [Streptomyces albus]|uniref:alpha/beta fold hydrolase n=1 Tax=Streptomyces albus TaxID=1888 RepID=UPI0004CC780A